jgi:hypothetical protein
MERRTSAAVPPEVQPWREVAAQRCVLIRAQSNYCQPPHARTPQATPGDAGTAGDRREALHVKKFRCLVRVVGHQPEDAALFCRRREDCLPPGAAGAPPGGCAVRARARLPPPLLGCALRGAPLRARASFVAMPAQRSGSIFA